MYGAAVDTYARNAADIVRAMNEDDSSLDVLSGATYQQWLQATSFLKDQQQNASMMMPQDQDQDEAMQAFAAEAAYGDYHDDQGRVDLGALRRHLQQRVKRPVPQDP